MSNKEEKDNNEITVRQEQKKETAVTERQPSGSIQGFSLAPRNLKEAMKISEYLAQSNLVPKDYRGKPADILVCINHGLEVGLQPLQSLSNIAVINGRPTMWGSAPLALARQHPEFEFILEDNEAFAYARDKVNGWEHLKNKNPDDTSICVVKRKGQPPIVREFSKEDVKTAGLGNVHKSYPKDMRKYRARSRALEASFGDALRGIRQAELEKENEEMGYYDDAPKLEQPDQREELSFDDESDEPKEEPKSEEKREPKKESKDVDKEVKDKGLPFK